MPASPFSPSDPAFDPQNDVHALKISELRYRRLFETARDGILLLDPEHGRIAEANPYIAELIGCAREEFLDKELWEMGLLPDEPSNRKAFVQLKQEGYLHLDDIPVQTRRGQPCTVEYVSNRYREDGHEIIQCNIRDTTQRHRMQADLNEAAARNERIAETLQRSMLQAPPSRPLPGVTLETLYQAALNEAAVGGDFFDAFPLSGEKVALIVGDVSGKGLVAAARTAEVKYALRAFLHEYSRPEEALVRLNDFIFQTHHRDTDSQESFIILAVAVMETATGNTVFSSAGAEPTLVLRADGTVEQVEIVGSPMGILPGMAYTAKTLCLEPGETVLMATDGITEARRDHAFLGIDGMAERVEEAGPTASLQQLCEAVYNGARDFAEGNLRDDICLLLARRE